MENTKEMDDETLINAAYKKAGHTAFIRSCHAYLKKKGFLTTKQRERIEIIVEVGPVQ